MAEHSVRDGSTLAFSALVSAMLCGAASAQSVAPSSALGISTSGVLLADANAPAAATQTAWAPQDFGIAIGRSADIVGDLVDFRRVRSMQALRGPQSGSAVNLAELLGRPPLTVSTLTSGFGFRTHPIFGGARLHSGVDLAAPTGSPIYARARGVVKAAAWRGGYGLSVSIAYPGGIETRYGHLSGIAVRNGQAVESGSIIGYVGSTGNSTGPHLHYEVRKDGMPLNPIGSRR